MNWWEQIAQIAATQGVKVVLVSDELAAQLGDWTEPDGVSIRLIPDAVYPGLFDLATKYVKPTEGSGTFAVASSGPQRDRADQRAHADHSDAHGLATKA